MGDWKEAYGIIADARANSLRGMINAKTIAETEFRTQASNSALPTYNGKGVEKEKSTGEKLGDAGKSVGKALIDVLSVIPYGMNDAAHHVFEGAEKLSGADSFSDFVKGTAEIGAAPLLGTVEGIQGAVGHNPAGHNTDGDTQKTGSDTVRRIQEEFFKDTDSDSKTSKRVQGGVGLASDIFLDPTTYMTLGAAPLIKGAVAGSRMGSKAASKAVDEAVEKGKAAGMSEEQIQRQILDHPDAKLYDSRGKGAVQEAKLEYGAWKTDKANRKAAKAERRANKRSGESAEPITPTLLGANVANESAPRPQSTFVVNKDGSIEAQNGVRPVVTNETAMRATKDFEARRAAQAAAGGASTGAGRSADESVGSAGAADDITEETDTRVDDFVNDLREKWRTTPSPKTETSVSKESTASKLIDSIQGNPVKVGENAPGKVKASEANAKLVETLGSSRAQEIVDVLGSIRPKAPRYNAATMRKVRKEYEARPSVIQTKNSLGPRSAQPDYVAPTVKADIPAPVAKEKSTAFTSGSNIISPIELHKTLMKLKSNTQVALKGRHVTYAPQIAKELRLAIESKDRAKVQGIIDEFHASWFNNKGQAAIKGKLAAPATKTIDEEVDEIIPDNPDEEIFELIDEANPNAVTEQELVEKFGIQPEDAGRLLDEIENIVDDLDMSGRVTNKTITDVSKYIQGKHIPEEELALLKKLTGKDTKAEVATEIRTIMNAHKAEINGIKNPKAAEGKNSSSQVVKTEEEIAAQAQSVEALAESIAKSPTALDAAVGQERMAKEYSRLREKLEIKYPVANSDMVAMADKVVEETVEYQMKHGAKKTARGFDTNKAESTAWKRGSFNSHTAITMHKSAIDGLNKIHGGKLDKVQTGIKTEQYLDLIKLADAKMRAMGIQPFQSFAHNIGSVNKSVNLSLNDILQEIHKTDPTIIRDLFFFNGPRHGFDVTQLTGAVEAFMRGKAAGMDPNDLGREIAEWFSKPQSKIGLGKKQQENLEKKLATKDPKRLSYGEGLARKLLNPKSTVYNNLSYRMLINSAQHATAVGKHVEDLTEPAIARIREASTARGFMASLNEELTALKKQFDPHEWDLAQTKLESDIQGALQLTKTDRQMVDLIEKSSKATKRPAKVEAEALAKADEIMPNGKPAHTEFGKQTAKTKVLPTTPKAINDARTTQAKMAEDDIRATAPEGAEEFAIIGASIATDMVRKIHPIKSFFVPSLGIRGDGVYRAMNTGLHTVAHLQNNFHEQLLKHLNKYGSTQLTQDFKQIQEAVANNGGRLGFPTQSTKDLYRVIDTMFAVSGKNIFEANGVGAEHFNALAKAAGLKDDWRFSAQLSPNENAQLWTKWEGIENVPDFLSKIHNVAVRASQDIAIGASFTKTFGVVGKREGYVKIGRRAEKDESIGMFELINRDMYYPIDIARDFGHADKLLRESRSVSGKTPMGKFVINVMDPITNALKASQTTVRPGHWVLSVVGDTLRNHLAGVTSITPYKQAIQVLKAGGHNMDEIGAIEKYRYKATGLQNPMVEGGSKGIKVNINGKFVNISNESIYRLMQNVVHLPPHSGGVMEDVLDSGTDMMKFGDTVKKATEFVTNNQAFNGKASLNNLASIRDNWMRTTLALDHIQKGKYKDVQQMKNAMEDFVTKWAPTSTDFTAKESKYLRRGFLYYTWLRGITPRVIEGMLNRPGMATWMNKAQYNMAQANGLDPVSFGNPFPEEGMYPDYYYNTILGPQWKDDDGGEWGINPSHPTIEVLNNFAGVNVNGNPADSSMAMLRAGIGMSTPFAKMPLELAMEKQSTGVPIESRTQYVLDNLSGSWASSLSRATGKTLGAGGIVDRSDSAAKDTPEDQAEHAKLQGINFMTGAQLKNYQSTEALKSAKYGIQEDIRKKKEQEYQNGR